MPAEVFPGVSNDFVKLNQKYYNDIPDDIKKLLDDKGVEFQIGKKVTQVKPELKGVHPRGWPSGTTWDSCEGLYDGNNRKVVSCETSRPIGKKTFVKNARVEGVFKHETGHALDVALDGFSETQEFKNAWAKDVRLIPKNQKRRYNYFIQKGRSSAGRKETFADVFSELIGNAENKNFATKNAFPNATKVIKSKLGL